MGTNRNSEGVSAYKAGRYSEAVHCFLESLPYDDSSGYILANLSDSYYKLIEAGQTNWIPSFISYSENGEKKHNARCANNLAQFYDPNIENDHVPKGYKSREKAIMYYKKHIEYAGSEKAYGTAYGNLSLDAYDLVKQGNQNFLSDAVFYAILSVERAKNPYSAYRLAMICDPNSKNGVPQCYKDVKKALTYYVMHIDYSKKDAEWSNAYNNMGVIYADQKGNSYLAACLYKIALRRDPGNETAKNNTAINESKLTAQERSMLQRISSFADIRAMVNADLGVANGASPAGQAEPRKNTPDVPEKKNAPEAPDRKNEPRTDPSDDSPRGKLLNLTGLDSIKPGILEMADYAGIRRRRQRQGLKAVPVPLHLAFSGNPGAGKRTAARLLAQIYVYDNILSKGQLVEVNPAGLVAGSASQTSVQTRKKISEAMGGILYIDNAYELAQGTGFMGEALNTILQAMDEHKDDFIVIMSGDTDSMEKFLDSNPDVRSAIHEHFRFPDYTLPELMQIFQSMCRQFDYILTADAAQLMCMKICELERDKGKAAANAEDVRRMFEAVITRQASRLAADPAAGMKLIEASDFAGI